ncbi:hypothetical protein SUGI_0434410 [Cryptomeria japonica]|nr:hypothetical protein SUGI_0434410 [Cryptomeria japonica]
MENMHVEEEEEEDQEKEEWYSPMVHLSGRDGMISCSKRRAFLKSYPLCSSDREKENTDGEIHGEYYDEDEDDMCVKKSCKRIKALLHPLTLMLLRRLKSFKKKAVVMGAYYTLKLHMTGFKTKCHGLKHHMKKCK